MLRLVKSSILVFISLTPLLATKINQDNQVVCANQTNTNALLANLQGHHLFHMGQLQNLSAENCTGIFHHHHKVQNNTVPTDQLGLENIVMKTQNFHHVHHNCTQTNLLEIPHKESHKHNGSHHHHHHHHNHTETALLEIPCGHNHTHNGSHHHHHHHHHHNHTHTQTNFLEIPHEDQEFFGSQGFLGGSKIPRHNSRRNLTNPSYNRTHRHHHRANNGTYVRQSLGANSSQAGRHHRHPNHRYNRTNQ